MKIIFRWAGLPKQYFQRWGNLEIVVSACLLLAIFSFGSGMFGRWVTSSGLDGFLSVVIQALSKADYSLDSWLPDFPFIDTLAIIEELLHGRHPRSGEAPIPMTDTSVPTITLFPTNTSTPFPPVSIIPSPTPTQGLILTSTLTPTLTPTFLFPTSPTPPEATSTDSPWMTPTGKPSATLPPVITSTPTDYPDQTPQVSATPTPSATALPATQTPTLTRPPATPTQTTPPATETKVPQTGTPTPTSTLATRPTHNPTFAFTPTSPYTPDPTSIPTIFPAGNLDIDTTPGVSFDAPGMHFVKILLIILRLSN